DAAVPRVVEAPVPPPPEPAPPPPALPPLATLHLVSSPPGARIYEGARMLGITPLDIDLPRENQTIELIAELEGHDDSSFKVNPYVDAGKQITVRLKKPRRGHKVRKLRERG